MCIIDVSSSGNRRINYYGVKARLGVRAVEEVKGALLTWFYNTPACQSALSTLIKPAGFRPIRSNRLFLLRGTLHGIFRSFKIRKRKLWIEMLKGILTHINRCIRWNNCIAQYFLHFLDRKWTKNDHGDHFSPSRKNFGTNFLSKFI